MRTRKPPHPLPKTKLKKFGGWGRNRDELTIFIFFLKFIAGSFAVIGCRLDPRNEKTRHWRVLRKPSVYHHLGLRGNRLGGRATEITLSV